MALGAVGGERSGVEVAANGGRRVEERVGACTHVAADLGDPQEPCGTGRGHDAAFEDGGLVERDADAGDDAPLANVEIEPRMWATLEEGMQINVVAVPGRPDVTQLPVGQIDNNFVPAPRTILLVCVPMALLGIVFFVSGILSWYGLEIKFDSKSGFHLQRIGEAQAERL